MSYKKITVTLLCGAILLTMLVSCENVSGISNAETSEKNIEEERVTELPESPAYEGTDFIIAVPEDRKPLFSSEEDSESIVKTAVYERNRLIINKYGINIDTKSVSAGKISEYMKDAETAGMQFADMLCFPGSTTVSLADQGFLLNLLSSPHFDINAEYIDTESAKSITTNNSLYMLYDSTTQYYEQSWVVFYDKKLITDRGLTDPAMLAATGEWTWEKFLFYSETIAEKVMNKGSPDLATDIFGFGAYDNDRELPLAMWESGGIPMFKDTYKNEVKLTDDLTGVKEKLDNLESIYTSKSLYPLAGTNVKKAFLEGRLAFFIGTLQFSAELTEAMEPTPNSENTRYQREWGLLPLPKLNVQQKKFCSFIDVNAYAISIPSNVSDPQKSITMLNAFCAASGGAIKKAVYDKYVNLFFQNNTSTVLLETVMDTKHFDMAALYGSAMSTVADISTNLIIGAIAENGVIDRPISDKLPGFTKFSQEKFK
ncbi:MAG: extracellular solute-binding protein [Eubacteriales bacterium]|nr:extracellular solute-binding protein [Eubacteriales bacterium]MDD4421855.1 extracellular solute-binding protein [Eubacteriales bacterium]